jgi:hypothetical protein
MIEIDSYVKGDTVPTRPGWFPGRCGQQAKTLIDIHRETCRLPASHGPGKAAGEIQRPFCLYGLPLSKAEIGALLGNKQVWWPVIPVSVGLSGVGLESRNATVKSVTFPTVRCSL